MNMIRQKQAVGLDPGSTSVKAVTVVLRDGSPVLEHAEFLDTGAEGILNEGEMYGTVSDWFRDLGTDTRHTVVGLPQYLATTQISDFPPGSHGRLEDMVTYETTQLAGLSEESFVHGFQVLKPNFGRRNPILIGVCRESVVRERLDALANAGIPSTGLGMDGIACLNALFTLHPEIARDERPHLLLNVGSESTTAVVTAGGQPVFTGTLDFGGAMYVRAIAARSDIPETEAKAKLKDLDLGTEAPTSPLMQVTRKFEAEVEDAVDHWRAQERAELSEVPIAAVWLCGGGARIRGLAEFLHERVEIPVTSFGPAEPGGSPMPEYAAAYGLALQGLGLAQVTICLLPDDVRSANTRRKRFPILAAALVLYIGLLGAVVSKAYSRANRSLADVRNEMQRLQACELRIPVLEDTIEEINLYESGIIPLAEGGSRANRFLRALRDARAVRGSDDWFVYVADEFSYEQGKPARGANARGGRDAPGGMVIRMIPGAGIGDTVTTPEFPLRVPVDATELLTSLIVAGYTPLVVSDPLLRVREIREQLRALPHYRNVDLLAEPDRVGREDIFEPWVDFFKKTPEKRYKAFSMRAEFATSAVVRPPSATDEKAP